MSTLNDDSELQQILESLWYDGLETANGIARKDKSFGSEQEERTHDVSIALEKITSYIHQRDEARDTKTEIKAKIEALDKLAMGAGEYHDDPYEYVVPLRHIKEYHAALGKFDLAQPVFRERLANPEKGNSNE